MINAGASMIYQKIHFYWELGLGNESGNWIYISWFPGSESEQTIFAAQIVVANYLLAQNFRIGARYGG